MSRYRFGKFIVGALVVLLAIGVFAFGITRAPQEVRADVGDNVTGWAWSGAGIGWISMNSENCNGTTPPAGCAGAPTQPYGVRVSAGVFSGYGWSSNAGYISFNAADVLGCPSGPCAPTIDISGTIDGWARVVGNATWPADKTWIHLKGIALDGSPYGIVAGAKDSVTNLCTWGGYGYNDGPLNWIRFSQVGGSGDACGPTIATPTSTATSTPPLSLCPVVAGVEHCLEVRPRTVNLIVGNPSLESKQLEAIYTDPVTGVQTTVTASPQTTWDLVNPSDSQFITINANNVKGRIKAIASTPQVMIHVTYSIAGASSDADATIFINKSSVDYCTGRPDDPLCSVPD